MKATSAVPVDLQLQSPGHAGRTIRCALVCAFALSTLGTLGGCGALSDLWPGGDNSEPPAELVDFTPTLAVREHWSHSVGAGAGRQFLRLDPALHGDMVFAVGARGKVGAWDAQSGEQSWAVDIDLDIGAGPGVGEGIVAVGSLGGDLVALDAGSGEELWRARLSTEVLSAPAIHDGMVVARTGDGRIFGLRVADGSRAWVHDRSVPALSLRGNSRPVAARGAVIAGLDAGQMVALSASDGRVLWETRVSIASGRSEVERMADLDGEPLLLGDDLYAPAFQGDVTALDLFSGEVRWQREVSSYDRLAGDSNHLYVTDDQGAVWALERGGGDSMWRQERLARRAVTGPAVYQDWVVVADFEGYLHWMRREDGQFVARTRVGSSGALSPPVAGPHAVYVVDRGGRLTAFTTSPPS